MQEAQSAFGAIEFALQNHQPSQAPISKIAQLSKQPASGASNSIIQSLLEGLSSEQQVHVMRTACGVTWQHIPGSHVLAALQLLLVLFHSSL